MLTLSSAALEIRPYGQSVLTCESLDTDKSRYHLWVTIQADDTFHTDGTVYKNAPLDTPSSERHRTIKLNIERGAGKTVGNYLLASAPALLPAAKAVFAAKQAAEEGQQMLQARKHRIAEAAPELFDALMECSDALIDAVNDNYQTSTNSNPGREHPKVVKARALIARIEKG